MRDDAVLRRALPLGRGLGRQIWKKMQTKKMSHEPVKFPQLSEDKAASKL